VDFVHLHAHSCYSLLQGAFTVPELVQAAAGAGAKAVALTDTNGLYGALEFYEAARAAGIRPILGAEIVGRGEQCVCLAANRAGYANLCRLVSERRLAGTPHARDFLASNGDYDLADSLAAHAEGLFLLSTTPSLLERLKGRVPDGRLYAELRADSQRSFEVDCPFLAGSEAPRDASRGALDAAERLRVPLAATVNVNFLRPEGRDTHAVLCAIRENRPLEHLRDKERLLAGPRSFFQSPRQVAARLPGAAEAMSNTVRIAEACELELQLDVPRFPRYDRLPQGQSACSYLREVALRGARERYGRLTRRVRERLERELGVIGKLDFCDYFLVVWDIAQFACREDIPHVGRGSAANSIVSYCLGISAVDPLKFDLYFERFLNEHRTDVPDIDMDFCWRRRDEVIDYVYGRYPRGQVAMVSTHSTLRARSAFRDVARVMGLPLSEINRYSAMLPHYGAAAIEETLANFPESAQFPARREPWKTVLRHATRVDGYVRHLSIHLGGMVIGDRPLTHYTALENSAKGIVITQYEMDSIERTGLVKIDLLGQRSLSIVREAAEAIERNRGVKIDLDQVPDRDARTSALLRRGRTMGCFQIESPGMRQLLQMLRAESIMDVIQGLSLIRPGPSGSGMKEAFIRRKRGEEPVTFLAPEMEEALRQTYGVMLYQEDILKVSQAVAGFSMAFGDELRKRITKARTVEAVLELREQFLAGARERGVAPEVAREIWKQIESFAAYSYCKAHATTYGHISYQAVYLKARWPAEFLASVIANKAGFYDARTYYADARRFNVEVLAPSVNESDVECKAEVIGATAGSPSRAKTLQRGPVAIRPGLECVRALSVRTVRQILTERTRTPFSSLEDFCARVRLTREELDNLILCGAFDWTGEARPTLMARAEMCRSAVPKSQPLAVGLLLHARPFDHKSQIANQKSVSLPDLPPFSLRDRVRWELSILGMTHSGHPLDAFESTPRRGTACRARTSADLGRPLDAFDIGSCRGTACRARTSADLGRPPITYSFELPRRAGERVTFLGWLVMMRHAVTKKREYMKFLCLEDRHGVVEAVMFPDVYRACGREMAGWGAYRVEGTVKEQHGALSLVVETATSLPLPP